MSMMLKKLYAEEPPKMSYIISGKVEIDHINDKYNLNLPVGDYETIAGFIIDNIGHIPKPNETVTIG
ncbi:MAG: hypothetical protein MZV64_36875 [Ignavibacteriales bacterium]|nr:hypothetical protein [Ignavibacteriales bacterium]